MNKNVQYLWSFSRLSNARKRHCVRLIENVLIVVSLWLMAVMPASAEYVLVSNGKDMSETILLAVQRHDSVVLDGKNGDFFIGQTIVLKHLSNKLIEGKNGARICTLFRLTPELHAMFDSAGVKSFSTSDGGGVLSNGARVREHRELVTRQLLIDKFNDPVETFRSSGGMQLSYCRNIVVRGLSFQGPGAVDASGNDLLGMDHSTQILVENCTFMDGMDGNMDITSQSDSIVVKDCYFGYSELSYDHKNSNLVGASDNVAADSGKLNVTYANCVWGEGCDQRMPMARYGTITLVGCQWLCSTSHPVIDARKNSRFIIKRCHFGNGVEIPFRGCDTAQWQWSECTFDNFYQPLDNTNQP